jgi:hypothetical protein
MSLPESYLVTTKNLAPLLSAIKKAQAPSKFTNKFLEQLDFKSTNDRLLVGVLKSLKLLDSNSTPTDRYFRFLDDSESKKVLGEAIKETYSDLFSVNIDANSLSINELKNKLKTLLQGSKTDKVISLMANTFKALCELADFSVSNTNNLPVSSSQPQQNFQETSQRTEESIHEVISKNITTEMHYNIQIHLPDTTDQNVFDAIFKSLKEHLL